MTKLIFGMNGLAKCKCCKKTIPKDMERANFLYSGYRGHSGYIRICGLCLLKLSNQLSGKTIQQAQEEALINV